MQGALREVVDHAAGDLVLVGGGVGAADLPEDLLLAHDHGIQARGHGEQVLDGGLGVAHEGVLAQIVDGEPGAGAQDVGDGFQSGVEGLDDGVDLDAVAGGDDHDLVDVGRLHELRQHLGTIGLGDRQFLENRHRRAAVRRAEQQNRHPRCSFEDLDG